MIAKSTEKGELSLVITINSHNYLFTINNSGCCPKFNALGRRIVDLAHDYFNLDALAEVEEVSVLARHDPALLDAVYGQQVDRVSCTDIVVALLEFSRNLLNEDARVLDFDRLSVTETGKDGVSGVLVEWHSIPINRDGCKVANPNSEYSHKYVYIIA